MTASQASNLTEKSKREPSRRTNWTPYLFLAIPLIVYFMWIIGPTLYTFYLSLTSWDGISNLPPVVDFSEMTSITDFEHIQYGVSLKNFDRLFADRDFKEALGNNTRWLLVFITIPTSIGLGLALIFNAEMFGSRFFKISFFAPLVLSYPVIGLIWAWIYRPDYEYGLINSFLYNLGVAQQNLPGWLASKDWAIWAIIGAACWRQVGYVMILYLAGLKNVDPSLVDAAQVDGANRWQLFRYVILPLLAPITTIIIIISIIDSLRSFDLVQVMTRGNKGTEVLANMMYTEAFNNYQMGYGAAIAVVLFAISFIFIIGYLWISIRQELDY